MGGGYYDRDVVQASSSGGYSDQANKALSQSLLHKSMDPKRWHEERMSTDAKNPIVVAIDVTGSMGNWSKIIYDKMPMFYGQIMMQGYLTDPALSICGVGDASSDQAPLQVAEFGQGVELDQILSRLWLEGGGGGNGIESYEMAAYFYANHTDLRKATLPFFFITGDEGIYENVTQEVTKQIFGEQEFEQKELKTSEVWKQLMRKYNVLYLHKPYYSADQDKKILDQWSSLLGPERILKLQTPKACVDVMLGAIALTAGVRDLAAYIKDMKERGQDAERIEEVTNALHPYSSHLDNINIVICPNPCPVPEPADMQEKRTAIRAYLKTQGSRHGEEAKSMAADDMLPQQFLCPIVKDVFEDPVVAADKITYERCAIEAWFALGNTKSPITGQELENKDLAPDENIKEMMAKFKAHHQKKGCNIF